MGLETATYISDLDAAWPTGTDQKSTADDHLRLIKSVLQTTFPDANTIIHTTTGSFTGTLTGIAGSSTATINYAKFGSIVVLNIPPTLSGPSNSASMTITGLPSALQPAAGTYYSPIVVASDNSAAIYTAYLSISAGSGTITCYKNASGASTWTNTGTKGLGGCTFAYFLV